MTCSETSNFSSLDIMKGEGLVSQEMLDLYLPEMDYNIVELMVCRSCVTSLVSYLTFAWACVTTEEKIKYYWQQNSNGRELVDLNHVQIFCKENEYDVFRKEPRLDILETKLKCNLKRHLLVHRENSEVKMYTCETCHFETKHINSYTNHLRVHKIVNEKMYRCETCHLKTKHKNNLKRHLLSHRAGSEVDMYQCEVCHLKTKHKNSFKNHLLVHKKNCDVEMYACETCNFKTKHKTSLKRHILVHRENIGSEVEMFECANCQYKTVHKEYLKSTSFGS
ncbi:hypothetical protein NQ317_000666 [Molorchus minor]|uniref:C2H2-type domain-containing protein n=1 Tax=Molorchus minor TaxID=1323400 RepID=A0ABQ9ISM6_9CUCU|nr:hypothetical protein NQ317_000666 [Molorchus minor]